MGLVCSGEREKLVSAEKCTNGDVWLWAYKMGARSYTYKFVAHNFLNYPVTVMIKLDGKVLRAKVPSFLTLDSGEEVGHPGRPGHRKRTGQDTLVAVHTYPKSARRATWFWDFTFDRLLAEEKDGIELRAKIGDLCVDFSLFNLTDERKKVTMTFTGEQCIELKDKVVTLEPNQRDVHVFTGKPLGDDILEWKYTNMRVSRISTNMGADWKQLSSKQAPQTKKAGND